MNLIEISDMVAILTDDPGNLKIPLRLKIFQINAVQSFIAGLIMDQGADLFIATATHTASSDGVTLPTDFARARDISINGYPIELILPEQRHYFENAQNNWFGNATGSYFAYLRGNKIYYYSGLNETVDFTYTRRLPKLHRGKPDAIGATTITLASTPLIGTVETGDDYYNHATVMILSGTGIGQEREITDYVGSTKVATVAAWTVEPDTSSVYEIKCELPEDPDFQILLCDIVSDKLGKGKGNKQVWEDLEMKLGQVSSRNSQNPMMIL